MALKILLAPNSYKGSADAKRAYHAFSEGVYFFTNIVSQPVETRKLLVCDGGTGFADIIAKSFQNSYKISSTFSDPKYRKIHTYYYISDDIAIIESAKTIGHALLSKKELNPLNTSTYGLGEMIRDAIDKGANKILLGCGDTATTDGGIGLLSALGVKFYDKNNNEIVKLYGKDLIKIDRVDFNSSQYYNSSVNFEVACNLSSIASGKHSTALVYSKQKGASDDEAKFLFEGINKFTSIIGKNIGQPHLGLMPGSGAAGGVGFGISSFFKNTNLRYSFEVVFERIKIDKYLDWADIVITGEGLFDRNSVKGKAPVAIALRAKLHNTLPVAIVGAIQSNITSRLLRSGFEIVEPFSAETISKEYYLEKFDDLTRDAVVRALLKIIKFKK